jgi:hypothetical protein
MEFDSASTVSSVAEDERSLSDDWSVIAIHHDGRERENFQRVTDRRWIGLLIFRIVHLLVP